MCCFSGRVQSVTGTKIFARAAGKRDARQFLVYEMTFAAADDLAMILPLPVPPRPREDAVRFVALDGYRELFEDLKKGFPEEVSRGNGLAMGFAPQPVAGKRLAVVEVGDFEASFVPTLDDFDRLDARFVIPRATWDAVPAYHDFGFAVFKLKRGRRAVHPMAFTFPRRDPSRLFFPTVHIHDGVVHETAAFDHALYCQRDAPFDWRASTGAARDFVDASRAKGIVDGAAPVYLRELRGAFLNEDVYV